VYFGGVDGSVYAVSTAGERQWEAAVGDTVVGSPAVTADTVYVTTSEQTIVALSAATGERQWTVETGGQIEAAPFVLARPSTSPIGIGSYVR